MYYWSRIIISVIIGAGVGLLIGRYLGDQLLWAGFGVALGIATDTSLRTIRNVQAPPAPLSKSSPAKNKAYNQKQATQALVLSI